MIYKLGCTDKAMVLKIQQKLKVAATGIFDKPTEAAVMAFQNYHNIMIDGKVGPETLFHMEILDTDQSATLHFVASPGLVIQKHYLAEGQFLREAEPILNDYIILHHTAGWENPYNTIEDWNRDSRGAIGTEFVIGGQKITNGNDENDGIIVQAFPQGCRAWHAASSTSSYLNRHSVGIEHCGFGQLTADSKTWCQVKADPSQVVKLVEPYKGCSLFHKYSDKQLYSLKKMLLYIAARDNIDIRNGIIKWLGTMSATKAFEFHQDAADGKIKGLLTHGNIVTTKLDMFPQQELLDMLLSL